MRRLTINKYRIYPNREQQVDLTNFFGCSRFVYNWALALSTCYYKMFNKSLSKYALMRFLTKKKKKPKYKFLKDVNAQMLQTTILNLGIAYQNFFKGKSKYPKFKNKHSKQSFQYCQDVKANHNDKLIYLPKIGWVKCVFDRKPVGKIKTCTVSKTSTNKYFISVLLETECNEVVPTTIEENNSVGIDLGIKDFAIFSNGEKFTNLKHLSKAKQNLAKQQKILSRKSKTSNNYQRQKLKVAKVHEKVSNQRLDFQHKLSHKLVIKNQETTYVLEDLSVSDMMQNKQLSYLISDCAWYQFYTLLKYKAERCGKNVIKIDRYFPSSKTCSECGYQLTSLPLNVRQWTCQNCETVHDRDINAAKNILKQGLLIEAK